MRPRTLPLVCLALLLLALAWELAGRRGPLPVGDEATPVMMVQSLWHDHDVAFREADLARATRVWDGGPAGLTLFTNDAGQTLRYGRPLAYPLAALPFYAVFGLRGIALFNMALFLAMAGTALWLFREETGGLSGWGVSGFFFASAAFAYAFRMEPEVFLMACAFFPLLVWRHLRSLPEWRRKHLAALVLAGALVGAALTSSPLLALLGLPVAIDLALRRRRGALIFFAAVLLAAGALTLLQRASTKEWTAFGGLQRRTFEDEFPFESRRDLWQGYRSESSEATAGALRLLPRNLGYVLVGRYTGLLPYFPFALFALILYPWGSRQDRSRHLLFGALAVYVLAVLIAHPRGFCGDPGFLGSRYLAIAYPAFLFLPGRISVRRSLVLPFAAAGLWTAAAVAGSLSRLVPEAVLQIHTQAPAFQRLPLELTLLSADRLPGFVTQTWGDALWIFPRWTFFAEERHPHGVWVRGGTRSEVIVVSPQPLSRLDFLVHSISDDNDLTLASNKDLLRVRFDTEGKRNGTPVDLAVKPVARNLGFFPRDTFYRFTLETTGGVVPARLNRRTGDPRDLGVFLDFTGEGY